MGEHFAQFDVDQANALLDEVGLTWDDGGETRLRPDGEPMEIVLECWEEFCPHSELVAEMWTDNVGVKTTMSQIERTLWLERNQANEADAYAHSLGVELVSVSDTGSNHQAPPMAATSLTLTASAR